ncbi:MAG: 3-dehydroquinate synthase [Lachnospiraceae bacterium]|nr:3-dehydroquinate synthase [Lachnospiraceae bacterium]
MSKTLTVSYENKKAYDIFMDYNYDKLGEMLFELSSEKKSRKVCIVSDSKVADIYIKKLDLLLKNYFDTVISFVFPEGESSKTLDTVQLLYEELIKNHFDRSDLLVALGGGVTGDLTGYAAATYLRGVDFIQVPTSLLSQVDSSIGGKTGVDFKAYKNMVGAFHMPKLVYMSMEVYDTLDKRQFSSGMAEEIKHALIRDKNYYEYIKANVDEIKHHNPDTMLNLLETGCNIKRVVVENDPFEKGERAHLNLGHTLGHAIEKLSDFKLYHGECVSLGTVCACYISMKKGFLSEDDLNDVINTLKAYDLPVTISGFDAEKIVETTHSDKKMQAGKIKFTLIDGIGKAFSSFDVTDSDMLEAVRFIER